jgi:hypothetical protein
LIAFSPSGTRWQRKVQSPKVADVACGSALTGASAAAFGGAGCGGVCASAGAIKAGASASKRSGRLSTFFLSLLNFLQPASANSAGPSARAFSSEVDSGSREENAEKQKN